ncbi:hypothetical protein H5T58_02210 [Candidatus Parcubacteria bacterium]|nr:hypothetical protein [Candidatus Parcubacteria bacterium]
MRKKLADILPKSKKEEKNFILQKKEPKKKKPSFNFLYLPILFLAFGALFYFLIPIFFGRVEIKIFPKRIPLELQSEVIFSANQKEIDFKEKKIPAQLFEIEKEFSLDVPASGKILKKAEGKIRLYNSYTTKEETWVSGTRFVSSDNKVFLSKSKIVVPGATMKEGKLIPSFVDVEVIAAEGGKDYNIGPSKFSIPAFKGTERYYKYYGESLEPMKGGGEVPEVKAEDIENGFKVLIEQIEKEKAKEVLKEEIPPDFVFPENLVLVEVLDKKAGAKEKDNVSMFPVKVKAKIKTLATQKETLLSFVKFLKEPNQPPDKELISQKEKIEFEVLNKDFDKKEALLKLNFKGELAFKVNPQEIKKLIVNKTPSKAQEILKQKSEIERADLKLFPFWLFKIPENFDKIKISILGID